MRFKQFLLESIPPKIHHPFAGGVKKKITKNHVPLIWENMLGTVNARDPETREEKYFDYDWDAAREFAKVDKCTDLRIDRSTYSFPTGPRKGKPALYGIYKKEEK